MTVRRSFRSKCKCVLCRCHDGNILGAARRKCSQVQGNGGPLMLDSQMNDRQADLGFVPEDSFRRY